MQKTVVDGGNLIWRWNTSSSDVHCNISQEDDCANSPNCIVCWVYPDASELEYSVRFSSTWAIPVDTPSDLESLDYSFSYSPTWTSSSITRDTNININTIVGDDERYTPLLGGEHNGVNEKRQASTVRTVMLNGTIDAQTRDIPVAVDLTFPRPSGATVYYRMKGATFHLIESRLAKDSESPPTNSPSVGPPPHTPIGLIIGVALGGLILFAAIASGILFYRRKHRHQRLEELEPEQYILPNTAAPSPDLPSPEPTISVGGVTPYRYSNLSLPSTSPRAKSGEFHRKQDSNPFASTFRVGDQSDSSSLPPAYIDESVISIPLSTPSASMSRLYVAERQRGTDSVTPSRSNSPSSEPEHIAESRPLKLNTPLAKWAKKNRKYIPERLERKLENAGYVPTDDPDQLTEDEWRRDWGVTIFELGRMRKLYAAKRRKRKQAQS